MALADECTTTLAQRRIVANRTNVAILRNPLTKLMRQPYRRPALPAIICPTRGGFFMTQSRLPRSLGRVSLRGAALALLLVGLAALPAQAAAGDLDTTFGSGGTVITIMPNKGWGNQIAIQPDGKLVVGGFNGANTVTDVSVVRYNTDGTLDTTFGPSHTGIAITNFGGQDYARATILQPDGKILAGGSGGAANGGDFALA